MPNPHFHNEVKKITSEFVRIEEAKENISRFLDENKELNHDDFIIQCLMKHLIIVFYAEIEKKLKEILNLYSKNAGENNFSKFLSKKNTQEKLIYAVNKKYLRLTFGEIEKEIVNEKYFDDYESFVINRHKIAHYGKTTNLTWNQLKDIDIVAKEVLKALHKHLDK